MARVIITRAASADSAAILSDLHVKAGLRVALKFRSLFRSLYQLLPTILQAARLARDLGRAFVSASCLHTLSSTGMAVTTTP